MTLQDVTKCHKIESKNQTTCFEMKKAISVHIWDIFSKPTTLGKHTCLLITPDIFYSLRKWPHLKM